MSEPQLPREVRRRLAIIRHAEEVTGNVAMTCRYYGISRQTTTLAAPLREQGVDGLRDRSRRPHASPQRHPGRRGRQDPLPAAELPLRPGQDRDVPQALPRRRGRPSGVWRILKRLDLSRLPASQRYKRLDKRWSATRSSCRATRSRSTSSSSSRSRPRPGPPSAGAPSTTSSLPSTTAPGCGCCASTHAATRRPRSSSSTTSSSGCPSRSQVIQTDNGAEFQSAFHYHVLDKGVGHRYIKPRTPRLNGKVERSHRIDAEEFYALLDGEVIDDAKVFNNKLRSGRTTTTTIAPTAASTAKHPTNDYAKKPRPGRNR